MDDAAASAALAALGHEARLRLFRLLVRAGPDGLNVGEIGRHLGAAPSTLAHHLGALVAAGLVTQERRGRETVNRAAFDALRATFAYVEAECCAGLPDAPDATAPESERRGDAA
ncbi:ArsR/SmtB family transcription factor [Rubrimonas cliftonensis]|uniref:Transcriptional regulator, ArsR family n=1 Tax=Rubrimonas cliftonensis TaxID=89524 RepID=A0A1H3Z5G9_9RHOB|nr:helix-turn-helix domain-containing protein [Rubrimonas cliftonensis]SEA18748.1 transcriptional regulator, ArsR family [Rubrimonas cliftonensis]